MLVSLPKAIKTKGFPTVLGTITEGGVSDSIMWSGNQAEDKIRTFKIYLEYKYKIADKTYTGTKRKWHEIDTTVPLYHQSISKKYPKGKVVHVFYDANKPSISVLEPGIGFGTLWMLLLFAGAITFLLFFITHQYN